MQDHLASVFIKPENENVKIWRFLDFTKYVSLLDNQSLFFSSLTKLEDPYEGVLPKSNVEDQKRALAKFEFSDETLKWIINMDFFKKFILVNCWQMSDNDSNLMWKTYVKNGYGVAIQSTFKKLEYVFSNNPDVLIGMVRYIDHNSDKIPSDNFFHQFLHKRKNFSDEQELRAITEYKTKSNRISEEELDSIKGIHIKIDLDELIEKIYVAPTSSEWFLELTKSVSKKFGMNKPIEKSSIFTKPDY